MSSQEINYLLQNGYKSRYCKHNNSCKLIQLYLFEMSCDEFPTLLDSSYIDHNSVSFIHENSMILSIFLIANYLFLHLPAHDKYVHCFKFAGQSVQILSLQMPVLSTIHCTLRMRSLSCSLCKF